MLAAGYKRSWPDTKVSFPAILAVLNDSIAWCCLGHMIALLRRDSTKYDRNCGRNTSRTRGSWRCERSKTLFLLATKSHRRARWPRLLWPRCGDNSDVLKVLPKRYRPITSSKLRHRKSTAASWEFQDLPQVDFHLPKASSVLTIPLARVWSLQRLENRQASLCRSSNCNSGMQVCRRTNQTRLHTNKVSKPHSNSWW